MHPRKYVLEFVSEARLAGARPTSAPLKCNMKLTSAEHDSDHNDKLFNNIRKYQRMVGKLLYLTHTRPDIVFVVQTISQYMQKPKESHWNATLRVIRYIKGNPELGLLMTSHKDLTLTRYCNAGWVACLDTRRSFTY